MYKKVLFFIIISTLIAVSGYILFRNKNVSTVSPAPTPTMDEIHYKTEDLSNGWTRFISDNYHLQFEYPQELQLLVENNFYYMDKVSPNESVTIFIQPHYSTSPRPKVNDFVVGTTITQINPGSNLKNIIEKDIQQLLTQKTINYSSEITPVSVGNMQGYVHKQYGGADCSLCEMIYYDAYLDDKHRISISVGGKDFTSTQDLPTVQKILSSFKTLP